MSLINDALQRAQQAQQTNPSTSSSLQFRPVTPGTERKKGPGLMVWAMIAAILLLSGVLISRQFLSARPTPGSERMVASAKTVSPASAAPATPIQSARTLAAPAVVPLVTNTPVAVAETPAPAPKPSVPRLQAIIYSSTRPSAIINGRTLYVGSRIGAFRVGAIQPNSATLISDTETNVLSLEER